MKIQDLKIAEINGEKVIISTFIGKNRNTECHKWHFKVFNAFNLPINYIYVPFENGYPYGHAINIYVNSLLEAVDYFLFFDVDAIPLQEDGISKIIEKIKDKNTIWGISQQSNHILKNNTYQHPYAGFSSCGFSKELYLKLGKPTFSETQRGDIGEELTWKCEELGYNVCLSYPSEFHELTDEEIAKSGNPKNWIVNNGIKYGLGTTFGGLYYHSFMASVPRSADLFISKAKIAVQKKNKKIEAIIVCKNYADYLSLTLPKNIKYFDEVYVISEKGDVATEKICEIHGAKFVPYDGFNKNSAKFNFGGARQEGIKNLKHKDWVVFLDCDIIIKEDFKDKLIDINKFYGSYRRFIPSLKDYQSIQVTKPENFETIEGSGCGFFQCVNYNHSSFKNGAYYQDSYSAEQVDIDFLRMFCPFINNQYLNLERMNIELWHLGPHGVNNSGRNQQDNFFN